MSQIEELDSPETLVTEAVDRFGKLVSDWSGERKLRILLTGGTLGIEFCRVAATRNFDLSKAELMFSDERFVALDHPDRNEAQALKVWPGLEKALLRFPGISAPLDTAALEMDSQLTAQLGPIDNNDDVFDLTVLGMGPDGHIASLFPDHWAKGGWVVSEAHSPKPPSERLSLSYEALNRSARVWFLVSGDGKANAVRTALEGEELPAGRVAGSLETVWFMDSELRRAL